MMKPSTPGAQTERRGDAGPVRDLLGGGHAPAALKRAASPFLARGKAAPADLKRVASPFFLRGVGLAGRLYLYEAQAVALLEKVPLLYEIEAAVQDLAG